MALPAIGTVEDLEAYSGLTIDPVRGGAILSAASTLVRSHSGRVWVGADGEWEEDVSVLDQDAVTTVVLTVADRVYRNPESATQQSAGAVSQSVSAWAAFGMRLTDEDKQGLPVSGTAGVSGLSSIRVVAPVLAAGVPASSYWWDEDEDPDDGS